MCVQSVLSSSATSADPNPVVVDAGDVVEATLSARDAFEVFMGRRYDPAEKGMCMKEEEESCCLMPCIASISRRLLFLTWPDPVFFIHSDPFSFFFLIWFRPRH